MKLEKMWKCAEIMVFQPFREQKDIAEELNVTEQTICNWKKREDFKEYKEKLLRERWSAMSTLAVDKMRELMLDGDYRAVAYILDSNGFKAPEQIEVKDTRIKVNIVD